MAKAIASGDPRLLQKAGLETDVARLERLRAAHFDDQHAIRHAVSDAKRSIGSAERRIGQIEADIIRRRPTRGDAFAIEVEGKTYADRKTGGAALLNALRLKEFSKADGDWTIGSIAGFEIAASTRFLRRDQSRLDVTLERSGYAEGVDYDISLTGLGLISRLEHLLARFETELIQQRRALAEAQARLPAYEQRLGRPFGLEAELTARRGELAAIDTSLAANE
jgi:hypothetical protein